MFTKGLPRASFERFRSMFGCFDLGGVLRYGASSLHPLPHTSLQTCVQFTDSTKHVSPDSLLVLLLRITATINKSSGPTIDSSNMDSVPIVLKFDDR
jgi:hypothetical protein